MNDRQDPFDKFWETAPRGIKDRVEGDDDRLSLVQWSYYGGRLDGLKWNQSNRCTKTIRLIPIIILIFSMIIVICGLIKLFL
jgi:hypothetical protein